MWVVAILSTIAIVIAPFVQPPFILALITILISGVFYFIRNTRYPAIGISIVALLYGINIIPAVVFLTTLAIVILGEAAYRIWPRDDNYSYLAYLVVASAGAVFASYYLGYFNLLTPITGVVVAALLKSILKGREDTIMIECLGTAMTMYLFYDLRYFVDFDLLMSAIIISFIFAFISYKMKAADMSGLLSAALMGILIIVFSDVRWFLVMLTFFILGAGFTKFKYEKKKSEGVAESKGGVRGFINVFANGLVSLCAAVLYGISPEPMYIALFIGSVAAAMADTSASELGMLGKTPYLITSFKKVPKGTDGGVTLFGEVAATLAAFIVCIIAFMLGAIPPEMVLAGTAAGFVGTNVDSFIGATLERRGIIGNAGTNITCTLAGGLFAMAFYIL